MHSSTRLRRLAALTACGALASALAWLPAGSAVALGPTNALQLQGSVDFSTGSPACSEVGTEPSETTPITNGSASNSITMDTTVTNTDGTAPDPADHTRVLGSINASTHLKTHNGALTAFNLTGTGSLSVNPAEGSSSQCDVSAQMDASSVMLFNESRAGWLYVTRAQAKNITTLMLIAGEDGSFPLEDLFSGPKASNTSRVFLKPGTYETVNAFILSSAPVLLLKSGAPTASLSGAFHNAGSALGGTRGNGGQFVKFPATISCTSHSAKLTWTHKAGQVAKGSFLVNGSKKASVTNPQAGSHVVLRHLSKTADNKITAKISLKGGGHATATRSYVPCQG